MMIPQTYETWRNCIVNDCKIELTEQFASARLAVYQNPKNEETKKFVELYGDQHLKNIIQWLQKI